MQNPVFENGKPIKKNNKKKDEEGKNINLLLNNNNNNLNYNNDIDCNKLSIPQEKLLNSLLESDIRRLEKKKNILITKILNNNI